MPSKKISQMKCRSGKRHSHATDPVWHFSKVIQSVRRDTDNCVADDTLPVTSHRLVPSAHQIPKAFLPQHTSAWRTPFKDGIDQPRIVLQPEPRTQRDQSKVFLPPKLIQHIQRSPETIPPALICEPSFVDPLNDIPKWQRLKDLTSYIMSPREEDQKLAAQALGLIGMSNGFVLKTLYQALQISTSPVVRYELTKGLMLLGCLDTAVTKEAVRFLQGDNTELAVDLLSTLCSVLQRKVWCSSSQSASVACESTLTGVLEHLVLGRDLVDDVSLHAASCLAFLDKSNDTALQGLMRTLDDKDFSKRMKALTVLVNQIQVHNNIIILALMQQLLHSYKYEHRIEACHLLRTIGMSQMRGEGVDGPAFEVLGLKLHEEPLMVVRQVVADTIEALGMKTLMWDLIERQLEDKNELLRKQAVISLSVLGLRNKRIFRRLLKMLDLDPSKDVRVQIIRLASALRLKEPSMLRKLQLKLEGQGILARAAARALGKLQGNDDQKIRIKSIAESVAKRNAVNPQPQTSGHSAPPESVTFAMTPHDLKLSARDALYCFPRHRQLFL